MGCPRGVCRVPPPTGPSTLPVLRFRLSRPLSSVCFLWSCTFLFCFLGRGRVLMEVHAERKYLDEPLGLSIMGFCCEFGFMPEPDPEHCRRRYF